MNKNIITAVIIAIILGLCGIKYYNYTHPEEVKTETTSTVANKSASTDAPVESTSSVKTVALDIHPDVPINGTYKGVIEVGASGFNCFVVNIDKDKNWELVSKTFGESLAYEGFATTADVYDQMKKYISLITDKGVAGRNVHFVMSSGALKNPKNGLIAQAIKEKGFVVNKVDADQEGKYALKALLGKDFKENSFTIDIGSGNTKITWLENGKPKTIEASGAKYYEHNKSDVDVYQEIKTAVSNVPANVRKHCFIIGGVPFKLAKESRNGEERFTALRSPDEYSAGDDVKYKSGLNIYRAVYENVNADNYIFDWDANFTIGFLLTLN